MQPDAPDQGDRGSPADQPLWRRHLTWVILLPFLVLSLLASVVFYRDYQIGRHERAGLAHKQRGEWADAIPHFEKLIEMDARPPRRWRREFGLACIEDGRYADALEVFTRMRGENSGVGVLEPLMICHYELGNVEQADALRGDVLDRQPTNAAASFYLGRDALAKGDYSRAGELLRVASVERKWAERAAPFKRQLAEAVLGDKAAETTEPPTPTPDE